MLCDNCKKNQSTIRYTEIRGGASHTRNLCEDCARSAGFADPLERTVLSLGGAVSDAIRCLRERAQEQPAGQCPACGCAVADFRRTGRLGCPECYRAFATILGPMLVKVHGAGRHLGKPAAPARSGAALLDGRRCQALRRRLDEAVEREEFELAARLRDKLRELEQEVAA